METNEFDLQEPAAGLATRRDARLHLELTPTEKVVLAQWFGSASYDIFVKLANGEIEKAETAHFNQWKNKEAFERTGLVAVATRLLFERIQKEINRQVEEFSGEIEFAKQAQEFSETSPEEII